MYENLERDASDIKDDIRLRVVIETLAIERVDRHLALIFSVLVPSQIRLIRNCQFGPTSYPDAYGIFIRGNDADTLRFEQWLHFLEIQSLITAQVNDAIKLTDMGLYFLQFIDRYNLKWKEQHQPAS